MPRLPDKVAKNIFPATLTVRPGLASTNPPDYLRPYTFHGVQLTVRGSHGVGDCPFCGKEGKFSVATSNGQWRCFVCGTGTDGGGGNALVFIRLLWDRSSATTSAAARQQLAAERGMTDPGTVSAWGVCQSIIDGTWLIPGYDITGKLVQVYRRQRILEKGKWVQRLYPTPGVWPDGKAHALHMPNPASFDPTKPGIDLHESWGNAMAHWEVARQTKVVDGHLLEVTGNESTSLVASSNIIAVPGCWGLSDHWMPLFKDKDVTIWYDSDHPREVNGRVFRAGFDGTCRIAKKLNGIARSVRWLRWGQDGYDPARPSGYDVRDHLISSTDRRIAVGELMARIEPAPSDWFGGTLGTTINGHSHSHVESLECDNWATLEAAWREALEWRQEMSDALAVLLAVCASTKQAGNQLFLDLIGSPGSAKTTMCRGLLTSHRCIHLENMTKLISGFKKPGDPDTDCSFLARANDKTWVTCEFDTLGQSPQYHELMGKVRRIFDGETSAVYGNSDEDKFYTALRTPWIRAGTPKMMDHDQSALGDRFLRYIITDPDEDTKRNILRSALRSEMSAIMESTNGTAGSMLDAKLRKAHALTGGYVNWLRNHIESELAQITLPTDSEDRCIDLADLSADLRARPAVAKDHRRHQEMHDCKELATRLTRQNVRLGMCLTVVLNLQSVDSRVMGIVRKVALDTACGSTLNIVRWFCSPNPKSPTDSAEYQDTGLTTDSLAMFLGMPPEKAANYMLFLRKIGICEYEAPLRGRRDGVWRLTQRVYDLYYRVMR